MDNRAGVGVEGMLLAEMFLNDLFILVTEGKRILHPALHCQISQQPGKGQASTGALSQSQEDGSDPSTWAISRGAGLGVE